MGKPQQEQHEVPEDGHGDLNPQRNNSTKKRTQQPTTATTGRNQQRGYHHHRHHHCNLHHHWGSTAVILVVFLICSWLGPASSTTSSSSTTTTTTTIHVDKTSPRGLNDATPAPTTTLFPSSTPSFQPTGESKWEDVSVDKRAIIQIEVPEGNAVSLAALATIWQNYLQNTLQSVYRNTPHVRLQEVLMDLTGVHRQLWIRSRRQNQQQPNTVANVQADVNVAFELLQIQHGGSMSSSNFTKQVDSLLENLLGEDNLQQALRDSNVNQLRVSSVTFPTEPSDSSGNDDDDGPGLVEMIIGFSLLGIAVASLLFWLHVYCKFRQKQAQERKRSDARKRQTTYIIPPSQRFSSRPPSVPPTPNFDGSDSELSSTYHNGGISTSHTDDDISDPFAQELEHAASADEEAWRASQKKKESLRREGRVVSSLYPPSMLGNNVGGGDNDDRVHHEEGVEIQAASSLSFPYGDDDDLDDEPLLLEASLSASPQFIPRKPPTPRLSASSAASTTKTSSPKKQAPLELSAAGAAAWATRNVSSSSQSGKKRVSFEPYGDGAVLRQQTSRRSNSPPSNHTAEFDEPVRSNSDQDSPRSSQDNDGPSTDAARMSPSVTSWSEGDEANQRDSMRLKMAPLGLEDDGANDENNDSTLTTLSMMKEVAQLSEYVKRYQEKKQKEEEQSSTKRLSVLSENVTTRRSRASGHAQKPARSPETSGSYLSGMLESDASRIDVLHSSSDLSLDESEDESMRLGINRFTVSKPPAPSFAYKEQSVPTNPASSETRNKRLSGSSSSTNNNNKRLSSESSSTAGIGHSTSSSLGRMTTSPPDTPPSETASSSPRTADMSAESSSLSSPALKPRPQNTSKSSALRPPTSIPRFTSRSSSSSHRQSSKVASSKHRDSSKLHSMRSSPDNMLDEQDDEPSDDGREPELVAAAGFQASSPPRSTASSARSKSPAFNQIVHMFESRPKTPVSPPTNYN